MFELLHQDFVQNAFMAGTIVAIVTPVMGYFVVLRAQAFAGEALADIGFAALLERLYLASAHCWACFSDTTSSLGHGSIGRAHTRTRC